MQKARQPQAARTGLSRRLKGRAAMTLVEVMIAFTIMIAVLCGSLTAMQSGYKAIDTARCSTLAAQIMQSRIEQLRLKSWSEMQAQAALGANLPIDIEDEKLVPTDAASTAARFTLTQTVETPTGRTDILDISLTLSWNGLGNVPHTRKYFTRYAKNGLYDYYY